MGLLAPPRCRWRAECRERSCRCAPNPCRGTLVHNPFPAVTTACSATSNTIRRTAVSRRSSQPPRRSYPRESDRDLGGPRPSAFATVRSSPSKTTWPPDTSRSPDSAESNVDLPGPFEPRMAVTFSGAIRRVLPVDDLDPLVACVHARGVEERTRNQCLRHFSPPPGRRDIPPPLLGRAGFHQASRAGAPFLQRTVDLVAHAHYQVHIVLDNEDGQPSVLKDRRIVAHRAVFSGLWPDVGTSRSSIVGRIARALASSTRRPVVGRVSVRTSAMSWRPLRQERS